MLQPTASERLHLVGKRDLPRPFLKWVGGKGQLLDRILPMVPQFDGVYHEPFLGGGALYFALRPKRAILSDNNERLVRAYRGLRDAPKEVVERLRQSPYEKSYYLAQRERCIDGESDVDVAVWMIYLNRTGFNGLYRVNRHNQFNVPFGRHECPLICDDINLWACADLLFGSVVVNDTFETAGCRAKRGDFVYFDPPYLPLSATSSFTRYSVAGFGYKDQCRLRDLALGLKKRGVHVLVSNSAAPQVYELYKDDFEIHEVMAIRKVNCNINSRGAVKELLIR